MQISSQVAANKELTESVKSLESANRQLRVCILSAIGPLSIRTLMSSCISQENAKVLTDEIELFKEKLDQTQRVEYYLNGVMLCYECFGFVLTFVLDACFTGAAQHKHAAEYHGQRFRKAIS
jgi:hypothetical protein